MRFFYLRYGKIPLASNFLQLFSFLPRASDNKNGFPDAFHFEDVVKINLWWDSNASMVTSQSQQEGTARVAELGPLTHKSANQLLGKINTSSPRRTILGFLESHRPRIESRGFVPLCNFGTIFAHDLISLCTVLMGGCGREKALQDPSIS